MLKSFFFFCFFLGAFLLCIVITLTLNQKPKPFNNVVKLVNFSLPLPPSLMIKIKVDILSTFRLLSKNVWLYIHMYTYRGVHSYVYYICTSTYICNDSLALVRLVSPRLRQATTATTLTFNIRVIT